MYIDVAGYGQSMTMNVKDGKNDEEEKDMIENLAYGITSEDDSTSLYEVIV